VELRQLRYFKHVAELGSFSKAASYLSVAQPALSRQVGKLEQELGVALLYRNGRGVTATEAGAVLLQRAIIILEQCTKTITEVTSVGGTIRGRVTLGLTPTISQVLTAPLIAKLHDDYPQVSLEVVEGFSGHVNEWLSAGRLDVGILNNAPRLGNLAAEELLVEELVLVGPAEPPKKSNRAIALKELQGMPLILPSQPHGLRELVDQIAIKRGLAITVSHEINALSTIKQLVEDAVGSTILPYASVHKEVSDRRMSAYRIKGMPFTQAVVLAVSSQRPLSLASRKLLDCIKAQVSALHQSGQWPGSFLRQDRA
jgi:LysR family nitrogen assimilation transcriptional regulator